ncbi:MAG: DUF4330 domain-containing protein [Clostridiales bacterium]|jgi:hypothetical protein|nr:DUF4330 domain-containing protein [Eubacteriales bacterium]MDH7567812.1 DUF4330 domain-containing protein [Clostridiales bacterium]
MIIDSKGKLFGKVSIIDILIILVLVAAAAGVGYKFTKSKTASPFVKTDTLEVQFYQEEVNDFTAKAIKEGDLAMESEQSADFGKVTDIKIGKAVSWAQNPVGQVIPSSKPGYSSIYITMETKGVLGDTGVKIGNGTYNIGKTITLKVGKALFFGRISDIQKKG